MTSTNDGKDVKSNLTSGPKGKTYYIELYRALDGLLAGASPVSARTEQLSAAWRAVHTLCTHSAPSTHPHLLAWVQRHTARTLLQTEWSKLTEGEEHKRLEAAIDDCLQECQSAAAARNGVVPPWESQLVERGEWFKTILANPWGDPVLRVLLDPRGEPPTDEEVLEWLKAERGVMFAARVRQLAGSKQCGDLALRLAAAVLQRVRDELEPESETNESTFANTLKAEAGFTADVWELLTDIEFVLLHKGDKRSRCIDLAKQTPLRDAYQLVERLQARVDNLPQEKKIWKNCKEVATLIAQVIITRCMVVPACAGVPRTVLYCCTRSLVRLLPPARLPAATAALAAPAATARHLHTLAAAVDAQSTPEMKAFVCELYVRAITAGMNELERLKLDTEKEAEALLAEQQLAAWLTRLGDLLVDSPRLRCECALTAFSLHPAPALYDNIQAAPALQPPPSDVQETKEEQTTSEFGSWATDSHTLTNFVKTSETLNLKQSQQQANVLSTAILSEGETLGLSPELCQDITVLLSGPRLKTLSWDMDRAALLAACRAHMLRTRGGTRAPRMRFLSLDPALYTHLPEEQDDDDDLYYGIEKGYEHLIEIYQEPEEIWKDAEGETTESAEVFSDMEEMTTTRCKKKFTKKVFSSADSDSNPLSVVADAKKSSKKKERPHSKERNKERTKPKTKTKPVPQPVETLQDPLAPDDTERQKEPIEVKTGVPKEKKKRERKKKDRPEKSTKTKAPRNKPFGLKISMAPGMNPSTPSTLVSDDRGKSSIGEQGNQSDIQLNGLVSTDEIKSLNPNSNQSSLLRNNSYPTKGSLLVNTSTASTQVRSDPAKMLPSLNAAAYPYRRSNFETPQRHDSVNAKVKNSITKLLQFRREKAMERARNSSATSTSTSGPTIHKTSNAIIRPPQIPLQNQICPKAVDIPDIPKVVINKRQSEQLSNLQNDLHYLLNKQNSQTPVIQYAHKTYTNVPKKSPSSQDNQSVPYKPPKSVQNSKGERPHSVSNLNKDTPSQKEFYDFLQELQKSINAGVDRDVVGTGCRSVASNTRPISRSTPEIKNSQCANQLAQQNKSDNALNTFSRRSYMHKNSKNYSSRLKQTESSLEHQERTLASDQIPTNMESRVQDNLFTGTKIFLPTQQGMPISNTPLNNTIQKPKTAVSDTVRNHPIVANILQGHKAITKTPIVNETQTQKTIFNQPQNYSLPPNKLSALAEKDQHDLLILLRQQRKQNETRPSSTNAKCKPLSLSTSAHTSQSHYVAMRQKADDIKPTPSTSRESNIIDVHVHTNIKHTQLDRGNDMTLRQTPKNIVKPDLHSGKDLVLPRTDMLKTDMISNKDKSNTSDKQNEWRNVLDMLRSHNTPIRGPKALEFTLTNRKNSSQSQRVMKTTSTDSIKTVADQNKIYLSNIDSSTIETPSTSNIPTTKRKENSITILNDTKIVNVALKPQLKTQSKKSKAQSIPRIIQPNKFGPKAPTPQKPKRIPQKNKSPSNNLTVTKRPTDTRKKQFTCSLPKTDDPFISGIPNSDYDLLEELMDDDLRQEIGELSDDDSYASPVHIAKDFKHCTNIEAKLPGKQEEQIVHPIPTVSNHRQTDKNLEDTPKCVSIPHTNATIQSQPTPTELVNISVNTNTQETSTIHHLPANVIVAPSLNNNLTHVNEPINAANPTNTFVAAIPQQNVLVIDSELVYEPCTVQTGVRGLSPTTIVTYTNQPNMTIYQSTQFAAPVISPCIIGNASISTPINSNLKSIYTKPSEVVTPEKVMISKQTLDSNSDKQDTQRAKSITPQDNLLTQGKDSYDFNSNKNCERKVLSEVQEKFTVHDKIDMQFCRTGKKSYNHDLNSEVLKGQDRLKKKRMEILNRNIHLRCYDEPIPLPYVPLNVKKFTSIDPENNVSEVAADGCKIGRQDVHSGLLTSLNAVKEVPNSLNTNDSKENKSHVKPTNKLSKIQNIDGVLPNTNIVTRNSKRLKALVEDQYDKPYPKDTIDVNKETDVVSKPKNSLKDNDSILNSIKTNSRNLQNTSLNGNHKYIHNKEIDVHDNKDSKENKDFIYGVKTCVTKSLEAVMKKRRDQSNNLLETPLLKTSESGYNDTQINGSLPLNVEPIVSQKTSDKNKGKEKHEAVLVVKDSFLMNKRSDKQTTTLEAASDLRNVERNKEKRCDSLLIPQSFKDSIIIEDIPNALPNDPYYKCVRIKLPNGRIFKATVQGKVHVNVDTLFSDPKIKDVLVSNITDKKRYTLNIKQISAPATNTQPKKTLYQEVKFQSTPEIKKLENLETINLLSDDEEDDSYMFLTTEFGKYRLSTFVKSDLTNHQKKLSQKSLVKLKRDARIEELLDHLEKQPVTTNTFSLSPYLKPVVEKKTVSINKDCLVVSEIIDLDGNSSDDCVDLSNDDIGEQNLDVLNNSCNYNLGQNNEYSGKPHDAKNKIDELKDLLLKDLAIQSLGIVASEDKRSYCADPKNDNIAPGLLQPVNNSVVDVIDSRKHINVVSKDSCFDCYVKLVNCDDLVKFYEGLNSNEESEKFHDIIFEPSDIKASNMSDEIVDVDDDEIVPDESDILKSGSLSRSGSFSILNDFAAFETDLPPEEIERISSPVINIFEAIAALHSKADKIKSQIVERFTCSSEWHATKQSMLLRFTKKVHNNSAASDCCKSLSNFQDTRTENKIFNAPSLVMVLIKFFQNNPYVIDRLIQMKNIENSPVLKRKTSFSINYFTAKKISKFNDIKISESSTESLLILDGKSKRSISRFKDTRLQTATISTIRDYSNHSAIHEGCCQDKGDTILESPNDKENKHDTIAVSEVHSSEKRVDIECDTMSTITGKDNGRLATEEKSELIIEDASTFSNILGKDQPVAIEFVSENIHNTTEEVEQVKQSISSLMNCFSEEINSKNESTRDENVIQLVSTAVNAVISNDSTTSNIEIKIDETIYRNNLMKDVKVDCTDDVNTALMVSDGIISHEDVQKLYKTIDNSKPLSNDSRNDKNEEREVNKLINADIKIGNLLHKEFEENESCTSTQVVIDHASVDSSETSRTTTNVFMSTKDDAMNNLGSTINYNLRIKSNISSTSTKNTAIGDITDYSDTQHSYEKLNKYELDKTNDKKIHLKRKTFDISNYDVQLEQKAPKNTKIDDMHDNTNISHSKLDLTLKPNISEESTDESIHSNDVQVEFHNRHRNILDSDEIPPDNENPIEKCQYVSSKKLNSDDTVSERNVDFTEIISQIKENDTSMQNELHFGCDQVFEPIEKSVQNTADGETDDNLLSNDVHVEFHSLHQNVLDSLKKSPDRENPIEESRYESSNNFDQDCQVTQKPKEDLTEMTSQISDINTGVQNKRHFSGDRGDIQVVESTDESIQNTTEAETDTNIRNNDVQVKLYNEHRNIRHSIEKSPNNENPIDECPSESLKNIFENQVTPKLEVDITSQIKDNNPLVHNRIHFSCHLQIVEPTDESVKNTTESETDENLRTNDVHNEHQNVLDSLEKLPGSENSFKECEHWSPMIEIDFTESISQSHDIDIGVQNNTPFSCELQFVKSTHESIKKSAGEPDANIRSNDVQAEFHSEHRNILQSVEKLPNNDYPIEGCQCESSKILVKDLLILKPKVDLIEITSQIDNNIGVQNKTSELQDVQSTDEFVQNTTEGESGVSDVSNDVQAEFHNEHQNIVDSLILKPLDSETPIEECQYEISKNLDQDDQVTPKPNVDFTEITSQIKDTNIGVQNRIHLSSDLKVVETTDKSVQNTADIETDVNLQSNDVQLEFYNEDQNVLDRLEKSPDSENLIETDDQVTPKPKVDFTKIISQISDTGVQHEKHFGCELQVVESTDKSVQNISEGKTDVNLLSNDARVELCNVSDNVEKSPNIKNNSEECRCRSSKTSNLEDKFTSENREDFTKNTQHIEDKNSAETNKRHFSYDLQIVSMNCEQFCSNISKKTESKEDNEVTYKNEICKKKSGAFHRNDDHLSNECSPPDLKHDSNFQIPQTVSDCIEKSSGSHCETYKNRFDTQDPIIYINHTVITESEKPPQEYSTKLTEFEGNDTMQSKSSNKIRAVLDHEYACSFDEINDFKKIGILCDSECKAAESDILLLKEIYEDEISSNVLKEVIIEHHTPEIICSPNTVLPEFDISSRIEWKFNNINNESNQIHENDSNENSAVDIETTFSCPNIEQIISSPSDESSESSSINLKGIEYEDPEMGTCYAFPLVTNLLDTECEDMTDLDGSEDVQIIQDIHDEIDDEIELKLNIPKITYSRKQTSDFFKVSLTSEKKNRKTLKRKINVSEIQINPKKYRKGKGIDYPKITFAAMADTTYGKQFKCLFDYISSLKFSYSIPFHKEHIRVHDLLCNWPLKGECNNTVQSYTDKEEHLFEDIEIKNDSLCVDRLKQLTLVEEIEASQTNLEYPSAEVNETNFNMGFGEGSGRVIQNLNVGGDISKFSAATLSDVKQTQPFLLSESNTGKVSFNTTKDEIEKIYRHVTHMRLREKVKAFFKNTSDELNRDWLKETKKNYNDITYNNFPFGLNLPEFVEPLPSQDIVHVVQIGQLPVSAAAQNPVTCDPRVTQVSDVSPSQCSAEHSPNDDPQSVIKTEYTELTTANLSLPLVEDYGHHTQTTPDESHKSPNTTLENNISIETEMKSIVKIELVEELPGEMLDQDVNSENNEIHMTNNNNLHHVDYTFSNNTVNENNSDNTRQKNSEIDDLLNCVEKQSASDQFPHQKLHNGSSEKTDQIAHAMNAAGITTTSETITSTRAHPLVNILSQKIRQNAVGTVSSGQNAFSKTTSINAMALQQALAQILPPPLNHTNMSDNNQQTANNSVTPQVLHIVQGKNASGNQITLVDNSQQSVINNTGATPVLHIVQNKGANTPTSNGNPGPQANSFSGLSLVDAGLQQGGNQLLHIVNTGNQKPTHAGQLLKRVNLLTNLTNVQGPNEQKMVQFVCKSADGKAIQLNAPHQRSMVLRLQPVEAPNVQPAQTKPVDSQDVSSSPNAASLASAKDGSSQQEIKSRSVYEENYAKFIQNSSNKTTVPEKGTSLPKFGQAFGKQVFQDGSQKQNDVSNNSNSHLQNVNSNAESTECQSTDNAINLEHLNQISNPPLLLRKSPAHTSQAQPNLVQQIKQTITPMNMTMHGGVIYTRQIPVNIGPGQTINLITVPSTELVDDSAPKPQTDLKFMNQGEMEPSIIKIVPQTQPAPNAEVSSEDNNAHINATNENAPTAQPQPVLTQMRIKLPMLSKAPQMVAGARVVRPSFFQIQRNVIGGANQPVYQQLVLTAAPPLGQQTIRLPQAQATRQVKVPTESQSSTESQMSSSTLEQLREFDLVLEQVKERSTVQPNSSSNNAFSKILTPSTDTTDSAPPANSIPTETTQQVFYSIGNNQPLNVTYVSRKSAVATPSTSTFVRSPDSSGIADSSSSSSHIPHTVTSDSSTSETSAQSKPSKVSSKSKSRPKAASNPPNTLKLNTVPPKTSAQKPLEDEQTTQRILYILAEYKEQVENSPDKDKPAPRRRSNPPSNPSGSSKRKKSSSGSRRPGMRDMSPVHGEDTCRTMGSEDSSCGTSQGDCNESCLDSHSPEDSPRKVVRKLTFEQETPAAQPRPQPPRNVIVADGQTITVARGTAGKPATAVLMPANYILPVSMVKGGQQIAIVTNRGPKLLTVGGGEGGTTNALLLQRLIGPAGLKPVLTRPGVRHVRLPTAALHNLQAFNLATASTVQPPDSTASPAPAPAPDLVDTRATSSPWTDRESDVKPERGSSPEGSEPWNLPSSADTHDYSYEDAVRADNMDRTVLDTIPDRYSPDMEAQRIFDKMFDVDSKKSYMVDSHDDSPRCGYDIDVSDCSDKPYHQVVQRKDGSQRHRLSHVSAAALRHKYAILEHELRLQKSLSEECEDLGVDSPSASDLFPEAELLFAASPAHDHGHDHALDSARPHSPQPALLSHTGIPQPDLEDQMATDQLLVRPGDERPELDFGLEHVGVGALDHEEFARAHPNTTFHSEPTDDGEVQPFASGALRGRPVASTIFHQGRPPGTVLVAPPATVISQARARYGSPDDSRSSAERRWGSDGSSDDSSDESSGAAPARLASVIRRARASPSPPAHSPPAPRTYPPQRSTSGKVRAGGEPGRRRAAPRRDCPCCGGAPGPRAKRPRARH